MDDMADLETRDHWMVGITSCMLFICYKIMFMYPFVAGMLFYFNMNMFNVYCEKRRYDKDN